MRNRGVLHIPVVIIVLLITWQISKSFNVGETARNIFAITAPQPKCTLSRVCPPDHFALNIRSGIADVVGPKICFEDQIIMSHVLNNVGQGLNIVVVNGENGFVENNDNLNINIGDPGQILAYLKKLKPGRIVLVASFDDVAAKMTNEIREVFVGMGSTLIKSVKRRDSWVFVGRAGAENKTVFEKQAVNDKKTNIYEGWPDFVELGGCFPKTPSEGHTP